MSKAKDLAGLVSTGSILADGSVNLASEVNGTLPIASGGTGTTSTTFANLTTNVTGTLPVANGGTGTTSTTFANLTTNVTGTLPVANGGTGTTSTTFANLTTNVTGTLPLANGGTNATTADGALTALGGTTVGTNVFKAVDAAAARTAIGAGTGSGDVTTTGTQELTNKTLTNPTVTNYVESVVAIGTVSSSHTLALTSGTVQTATLTASTACTFTMPTATAGKSFVLLLKQAASTGNGTATFTSVKWGTAGAPTITAAAGKMDILSFISDGTNWYGSITQGYTP